MQYKLNYDSELKCVVLRIKKGKVTFEWIRETVPKVVEICSKNECKLFLNDMSAAEIDVSLLEIYSSPRVIEESGLSDGIKRALIKPRTFKKANFLRSATKGRNHDFMVFDDIDEAKEWLFSDTLS